VSQWIENLESSRTVEVDTTGVTPFRGEDNFYESERWQWGGVDGIFLVVDWSGVTNISNSNFDCDEIWGKKE
jgi:hypothetical protein